MGASARTSPTICIGPPGGGVGRPCLIGLVPGGIACPFCLGKIRPYFRPLGELGFAIEDREEENPHLACRFPRQGCRCLGGRTAETSALNSRAISSAEQQRRKEAGSLFLAPMVIKLRWSLVKSAGGKRRVCFHANGICWSLPCHCRTRRRLACDCKRSLRDCKAVGQLHDGAHNGAILLVWPIFRPVALLTCSCAGRNVAMAWPGS